MVIVTRKREKERERYFSTGRNRRFKRSRLKATLVSPARARARARKRNGDNYLSERIIKNAGIRAFLRRGYFENSTRPCQVDRSAARISFRSRTMPGVTPARSFTSIGRIDRAQFAGARDSFRGIK